MFYETTGELRKMIDGISPIGEYSRNLESTRIVLRELLERIVEIESKIATDDDDGSSE